MNHIPHRSGKWKLHAQPDQPTTTRIDQTANNSYRKLNKLLNNYLTNRYSTQTIWAVGTERSTRVASSRDWALSMMEPGRAMLTVGYSFFGSSPVKSSLFFFFLPLFFLWSSRPGEEEAPLRSSPTWVGFGGGGWCSVSLLLLFFAISLVSALGGRKERVSAWRVHRLPPFLR